MEKIVELLSKKYNFNFDEAIEYIKNDEILDKQEYSLENIKFQIPYYGVIHDDCCKAIIFNSGLYTQCRVKTTKEFCKSCTLQKYGTIYDRKKYNIGEFVCKNGKKEKDYILYLKSNNIDIEYVKKLFEYNKIDYPINIVKLSRGRPKIKRSKEVGEERIIENREEAKIEREIVESRVTREIIGVKKNGKVERI